MKRLDEMVYCPELGIDMKEYLRCWHCVYSMKLGMAWFCIHDEINGRKAEK